MKELSIEDKAKRYDEVIELVNSKLHYKSQPCIIDLSEIFPELKESEDEKIRKEIIDIIDSYEVAHLKAAGLPSRIPKYIAWLEKQGEDKPVDSNKEFEDFVRWFVKQRTEDYTLIPSDEDIHKWAIMILKHAKKYINAQKKTAMEAWKEMRLEVYAQASGNRHEPNYSDDTTKIFSLNDIDEIIEKVSDCVVEQKPTDKVEPMFKVGDWVVYCNEDVDLITGIKENGYCINNGGYIPFVCASDIRLWTIQDAKDGDVLVASDDSIFLFKGTMGGACKHYVALTTDGVVKFNKGLEHYWETYTAVHPATKEQRNTLMKAMINVGYTFDFDKKELKKIEQKEGVYNKLTDYNLTDFEVSLKHIMEEAIECGDTHNLKADAELLISIAYKQFIEKSAERLKNRQWFTVQGRLDYGNN